MWIDIAPSMDKKGWSQRNLAAALGKEPTVVSRFFKPNFDPKISLLIEIADVLEVDVRDLFNPGLDANLKTMPKSKKTLETLEKLGLIDPPRKKATKKKK